MQICLMQIFPKLKKPNLHKQFQPTVYSVVIIPLLPVHRTIENFSVELMLLLLLCSSISFRHTTHRRFCLGSLSTISLYHAKYVILTLMPYALVRLPLLRCLCRSDSCWVMEFKVLVKISILFLALMLAPLYALASSKSVHLPLLEHGILILKLVDFYSVK